MKKILLVLLTLAILVSLNNQPVRAQDKSSWPTVKNEVSESTDAGNKICPVSGDKINKETKATYEYEGKIYNFCCPMCIEEFKKDPQKYINKVEEELKGNPEEGAKAEEKTDTPASTPEVMHEGDQH